MGHRFDWRGFSFVMRVLAICVFGFGSAQLGWVYAESQYGDVPPPALPAPAPATTLAPILLSTTTPERIIDRLSIADVIPSAGRFIAADLRDMRIHLYQDGALVESVPIKTKGKPGTPWETPSGFYAIQTKEESHFSSIGKVYMPYSMQFYGNYFIHGWTTYPDGTPTPETFSGGCIKLDTAEAAKVFAFAEIGTQLFVYDPPASVVPLPLPTASIPLPRVSAPAYLVADLDTGDVYAERAATTTRPIASLTKLMTALVANETISFDKEVRVAEGMLMNPRDPQKTRERPFAVGDLLYPLLMQSSNNVADALAAYYGAGAFVSWMNTGARALGMQETRYADPSGLSAENTSTAEDLFRLARYLEQKKSFIFAITRERDRTIAATDGTRFSVKNVNDPADRPPFLGGKIGYTDEAKDTMLSLISIPHEGRTHTLAIIVLGSEDRAEDTARLARWIETAVKKAPQTACSTCGIGREYRRIEER